MFQKFQNYVLNKSKSKINSCNSKVLPNGESVAVTVNKSVIDNNVHSPELYYQSLCNTCNNNLNDNHIYNCIHYQQDHNDPGIEPKWCQHINSRTHTQASVVACGETNPQPTEPGNVILCTCDITNIYYHDCSDNSDTYHVYLHKNFCQKPPGFYFLKRCGFTGHMTLYKSFYSLLAPLDSFYFTIRCCFLSISI